MSTLRRSTWLAMVLAVGSPAGAQHHHPGSFASFSSHGRFDGRVDSTGSHRESGVPPTRPLYPGAIGGGYGSFGLGFGAYYGIGYYPPPIVLAIPVPYPADHFVQGGGGLRLPLPPQGLPDANPPRPRRPNPSRAKELVEIGDRSFRVGNIKRAEEKFNMAGKADPTAPPPHVHLAQVSIARGHYSAAADHLRDAITIANDPGFLTNIPDIQAIFGEPADFAKQLARLESHLQANPGDRDAWFVLGAEYYLSGRARQASDVFRRLTDRRPDEALAAFIDASTAKAPAVAN